MDTGLRNELSGKAMLARNSGRIYTQNREFVHNWPFVHKAALTLNTRILDLPVRGWATQRGQLPTT
jgi:hypothetical protein